MADPLDKLRPEVREAWNRIVADEQHPEDFECVEAELLRLAKENADLISTIDLDEQVWVQRDETMHRWIERARNAEAELAALKARIAESHEVTVCRHPAGAVTMFVPEGMNGKRVRLVVDEPCDRGEG